MPDEIGPRLATALGERFQLGPVIGRGGMGVVFRALDTRLQRDVAIKVLPPELSYRDELRARFAREAQLAAGLSHPHIVPIYGVGEGEGLVWYEMAFVDGESIRARVDRDGPLTEPQTRRVIREVAWALGYAHARGIVHRDIKPDNILLERGTGRALVTDFGIAKVAEGESTTQPGMVVGSLMYMAPEQATGEHPVDGRADLYSLGLCGHYMLTGRPPFAEATLLSVAARVATGAEPEWPAGLEVGHDLRRLLDRCLAPRVGDRWPDAEAILEALGPQAVAPRPMPASIRRLVRDFMLLPTVGFLVVVIDIVAANPDVGEFLAWLALALTVNFGVTLRHFTRRGFRWADLREGLETEFQRHQEELEVSGALRERFSAFVYMATATGVAVGLVQAALEVLFPRVGLTDPLLVAGGAVLVAVLAVGFSLPFSWLQVKVYGFLGRMVMKLVPSLPRPEAEGRFSRFLDRLLTRLFRPPGKAGGPDVPSGATLDWNTSEIGAARRSTRSIEELLAALPRATQRDLADADAVARALAGAIDRVRQSRARLDREHQEALSALTTTSREANQSLDELRNVLERVGRGAAHPEEAEDVIARTAASVAASGDPPPTDKRGRRWWQGVFLQSALTGSAYHRPDPTLADLAGEVSREWNRHPTLPDAWPADRPDVTAWAHRLAALQASVALHEQRGRALDAGTTGSLTQCEEVLGEVLSALKRRDADERQTAGEIEQLLVRLDRLHGSIQTALGDDAG